MAKKTKKDNAEVAAQAAPNQEAPGVGLDAWNQVQAEASGVTTEQLDNAAKTYQEKYAAYEAKKKEASKLNEEADVLEAELIGLMEAAGKSKYHVETLGTFYFSDKLSVQTPKSVAAKKLLAQYIQKKYGDTVLWDKLSINSQTLQSFYNSEFELFNERSKAAIEAGTKFDEVFTIPGLNEPTNRRSLNLRKEK